VMYFPFFALDIDARKFLLHNDNVPCIFMS